MKQLLILFIFSWSGILFGQITDAETKLKNATKTDTIRSWKKGALFNLGFSQVTLSNWAAGGNNSISGTGVANFHLTYKGGKCAWENNLILGYGILKQNQESIQKTDDNIELTSTYGRKATQNWFYSGLINFKSQFTDGFNYPNDSVKISTFLAPGYLLGAAGMNYKIKERIKNYKTNGKVYNDCLKVKGTGETSFIGDTRSGPIKVEIINTEWICVDVGLVKQIRQENTNASAFGNMQLSKHLVDFR